MKACSACKRPKPLTDFHKASRSKDGRAGRCKVCKKDSDRKRYERHGDKHRLHVKDRRIRQAVENRSWVASYLKDHPCTDCKEPDPVVLEFDHVRGTKRANVASMVSNGYALMSVQEEVAKCDVRCANCHRRKTARERGWHTLYDDPIV
jgi:hypothetical protein